MWLRESTTFDRVLCYLFWGGFFGLILFPKSTLAGFAFSLGCIGIALYFIQLVIAAVHDLFLFMWRVFNGN